jgi:hypothetical protein
VPQGKYQLADAKPASSSGAGRFRLTDVEVPLTRERRAPGAPSAMDAGHHPETLTGGRHAEALRMIDDAETPTDAAFLKRGPEVGGAGGMVIGGPAGAGVGAALGSLAKGQHARGAHMPTTGEMGGAALQGGKSLLLSAVPGLSRVAGERVGPVLTNNASRISRALRGATGAGPMAGVGMGLATGNPIVGMATSAASRAMTSPSAIRAVGNVATRVGETPMHAVNKIGFGAISAEAFRQALLDALAEDSPASAVP